MVLQTVLLVAISVFGYNVVPYYQNLCINAGLALTAFLLLAVRPHAHASAGKAALQSIGCLFITIYAALSFIKLSELPTSKANGMAMGAIVWLVNLAFVLSTVWQLVRLVDWPHVWSVLTQGLMIVRLTCSRAITISAASGMRCLGTQW